MEMWVLLGIMLDLGHSLVFCFMWSSLPLLWQKKGVWKEGEFLITSRVPTWLLLTSSSLLKRWAPAPTSPLWITAWLGRIASLLVPTCSTDWGYGVGRLIKAWPEWQSWLASQSMLARTGVDGSVFCGLEQSHYCLKVFYFAGWPLSWSFSQRYSRLWSGFLTLSAPIGISKLPVSLAQSLKKWPNWPNESPGNSSLCHSLDPRI
jgi:hypothetical protein